MSPSRKHLATRPVRTAAVVLTAVGALAFWALREYHLRRQLAEADRDPVTGALRRNAWERAADRILVRAHPHAAVLLVDIDDFKSINDTYGHAEGDRVLRTIVTTMRKRPMPGAAIGRFGGDEIVVCLPFLAAGHHAWFLDSWLREVSTVAGVGLSCGMATTTVAGSSRSRILRGADLAMYSVKGTDRLWALYEPVEHGTVLTADPSPIRRLRGSCAQPE